MKRAEIWADTLTNTITLTIHGRPEDDGITRAVTRARALDFVAAGAYEALLKKGAQLHGVVGKFTGGKFVLRAQFGGDGAALVASKHILNNLEKHGFRRPLD